MSKYLILAIVAIAALFCVVEANKQQLRIGVTVQTRE
jgi:hypothetical protein